jgi:large subunit ribosomal protein L17
MRHRVKFHGFGRKPGPRKALIRGLVTNLVEHGRITTTLVKAKELRRHVEKAITAGKAGTVHTRRTLLSKFPNKDTVKTIVDDLSVRFKDRNGGYTRVLKVGTRPGDNAEMAIIEFVDYKLPDPTAAKDASTQQKQEAKSLKEKAAKKKRVRKIQQASRRKNRPTK